MRNSGNRAFFVALPLLAACNDQGVTAFNASPEAEITSHQDGGEVMEGYQTAFHGYVSDVDHDAGNLLVTWFLGGEEICPEGPPSSDGMTTCSAVVSLDDTLLVLEVHDPKDAASSDAVSLVVTPTDAPTVAILAPEADGVYYSDQLVTFSGLVSDAEDDPTALVTWWESSADGTLTLDALPSSSGELTDAGYLTEGQHLIELHVEDTSGKTASDSVVISVGPPNSAPTCAITAPASGSSSPEGGLVVFEAEVSDPDVPADWLSVVWSSDRDGVLGASTPYSSGEVQFTTSDLSVNSHNITISVTDEVGATCTHGIIFTVGAPPSVAITEPGGAEVFNDGDRITFAATVEDNEDRPDALTLEWASDLDGVLSNQSADSSGAVTFSTSSLSTGSHSISLTATDTDGLYARASEVITVNALPTQPTVSISPDPATTSDDLVAIATGSTDPDGSGTISYSYTWYEDGVISAASTSSVFPSSATSKERRYRVAATPSDGTGSGIPGEAELVVSNSPPVVTVVTLSPSTVGTEDTVTASSTTSDADGDSVSVSYAWYVDASLVLAGSSALDGGYFERGDAIVAVATPNDGTIDGTPVSSSALVVSNTAPTVTAVTIEPSPAYTGDVLTCTCAGFDDPDGDADASTFAWTVDGVGAGSGSILSSGFLGGDSVNCTVTPHDGLGGGTPVSATLVVGNSAPSLAGVSITPDPAYAGDTLTCAGSGFTDPDGDANASTYTWTVNDSAAGTGSTLTSGFVRGDAVVCEATPYDGQDSGSPVGAEIVIGNTAPEVSAVAISPSSATTADTLSAGVTVVDVDGDDVALSYSWYVEGVFVTGGTSTLDGMDWFSKGERVYVEVTPSDGDLDGAPVSSGAVTILNSAPGAPEISIDPATPHVGSDDLVCMVDVASTDADGDSVTYTFAWEVDGVAYTGADSTYETGDTVPAGDTNAEEVWTCTVVPSDRDDDGSPAQASVTVTQEFTGWGSSVVSLGVANYTLLGENAGDRAGFSVAGGGDIDGDGLDDLVVGAPYANGYRGRTYVVFSSSLGASADFSLSSADAVMAGEAASDYGGRTVAVAGDVDGDGLSDVLIGAYGNDDMGSMAGKACLMLGSTLASGFSASLSSADYEFLGESAVDYAGYSLASAGDVDGDGLDDVLIGAYGADGGGTDAGKACLIWGASIRYRSSTSLSLADYSFIGETSGDRAGYSVAGGGDIDGDGYGEVLVGSYVADTVYVIAGSTLSAGMGSISAIDLSAADYAVDGFSQQYSIDLVDIDGDGADDLVAGDRGMSDGGTYAGGAYIVLGSTLSAEVNLSAADSDYRLVGEYPSDYAGSTVAAAGDVDGDGVSDLLIGAWRSDDGGTDSGKGYLLLADTFGSTSTIDLFSADFGFAGEFAYSYAGSVSSAGDVNGDGLSDLIIGAYGSGSSSTDPGRAYLLITP